MDAIEFMKERKRMCNSYSVCTEICPLKKLMDENRLTCLGCCFAYPKETVAIVKKWSAENPIKTRQSEFLKMFPDADIHRNGILEICPRRIENSKMFDCHINCNDCRKEYWLAGVE